ncbi:unnamed protein product [Toxocara canis]|uniref:DUF2892 domain-containing protein n=1 Tax=Toxocara canis TaxID=6265 RepID=A0A183V0B7_TOXCA|nr:unnamed protein product [Toxocara canis]
MSPKVDNELSQPSIYIDRTRLLGIASGARVMLAALLLLVFGLSLCSVTNIILQVAFLFAYFQ